MRAWCRIAGVGLVLLGLTKVALGEDGGGLRRSAWTVEREIVVVTGGERTVLRLRVPVMRHTSAVWVAREESEELERLCLEIDRWNRRARALALEAEELARRWESFVAAHAVPETP